MKYLSDYHKTNNFAQFRSQFQPVASRSRRGETSFRQLASGRVYRDVLVDTTTVGGSGNQHDRVEFKGEGDTPQPVQVQPAEIDSMYDKNPYFFGRDEEINNIHALLNSHGKVGIAGIGGIGKTALCVEYYDSYQIEYPGGFYVFNGEMNYEEINSVMDNIHFSKVKTLILIDEIYNRNIRNRHLIDFHKKFNKNVKIFHVLTTARNPNIFSLSTRKILLEPITDRKVASQIVLNYKNYNNPEPSPLQAEDKIILHKIVQMQHGIPLALEQVGMFMNSRSSNFQNCSELLQEDQMSFYQLDDSQTRFSRFHDDSWKLSWTSLTVDGLKDADFCRLSKSTISTPMELTNLKGQSKRSSALYDNGIKNDDHNDLIMGAIKNYEFQERSNKKSIATTWSIELDTLSNDARQILNRLYLPIEESSVLKDSIAWTELKNICEMTHVKFNSFLSELINLGLIGNTREDSNRFIKVNPLIQEFIKALNKKHADLDIDNFF